MPGFDVAEIRVLTSPVGWQPSVAPSFRGGQEQGMAVEALVVGAGGIELDLSCFMGDSGEGSVRCVSRGTSPETFERLVHGARLGLYAGDERREIRQLRLLRWDAAAGWGNPSGTDTAELTALLGADVETFFRALGALDLGTKEAVLGTRGRDLVVTWPLDAGPEVPLAAYALTRVLPIVRAGASAS
jgi:hypothetical protein